MFVASGPFQLEWRRECSQSGPISGLMIWIYNTGWRFCWTRSRCVCLLGNDNGSPHTWTWFSNVGKDKFSGFNCCGWLFSSPPLSAWRRQPFCSLPSKTISGFYCQQNLWRQIMMPIWRSLMGDETKLQFKASWHPDPCEPQWVLISHPQRTSLTSITIQNPINGHLNPGMKHNEHMHIRRISQTDTHYKWRR